MWKRGAACGVLAVAGRALDEKELVARAQRGDETAYEDLVRMRQGIAVRVAYLVCGDDADAQDAAQEAFVKAYRALWRFPSGAPLRRAARRSPRRAQPAAGG